MRRPVSASAFGPRGHRGSVGLLASGLAAAGPAVQAPYMIFAAVGLIGAAVVVQADTGHRPDLLSQIAFVGSALAMVGWVDLGAQPSDRVVLIGLVAAIAGLVAADLVGWRPSDWAINLIVSGCLGAGVGAALLISGHVPGVVFAGLGLTLVGIGVADMAGRRLPGWITQMGAGLMAVGVGVAELIGRQLPVGIAFICGGLAAVGYGALAFLSAVALLRSATGLWPSTVTTYVRQLRTGTDPRGDLVGDRPSISTTLPTIIQYQALAAPATSAGAPVSR